MPGKTSIEWTDFSWNPLTGCTRVSDGCTHCYAFELHDKGHKAYLESKDVPQQYARPFSEIQLLPERLNLPFTWKGPRKIFVASMSDLFHSQVPEDYIRQIFEVMRKADWHIFQILTKRAGRLRHLGSHLDWPPNVWIGVSIETDLLTPRADALQRTAHSSPLFLRRG